MANEALGAAKEKKNDEFYTQYDEIQREINAYLEYEPDTFRDKTVLLPCDDPEWSNFTRFFAQNFERLGLKKLISTSYASESKCKNSGMQLSIFDFLTDYEKQSPQYDESISPKRGKIFTLTRRSKKIDINDLQWKYLEGDGDFRSDEVKKLRDEADIIVTNPPFSLFREFLAWIIAAEKKFIIIGNMNAITYKEVFPYLKNNNVWLGCRSLNRDMYFDVPEQMKTWLLQNKKEGSAYKIIDNVVMGRLANACWFTNLDHGRRHQPLPLMTMADNLKFSKHKDIKEKGYQKYTNYDAIEVPYTDAIPCDYDGAMGVPITFLDKYCPEQFVIVGISLELADDMKNHAAKGEYLAGGRRFYLEEPNGNYKYSRMYDRIVIRRKQA